MLKKKPRVRKRRWMYLVGLTSDESLWYVVTEPFSMVDPNMIYSRLSALLMGVSE